ncbi:MAG: chromosome partitioning protein, partial [Bdellovibrionales bacterium]|nr:chromosome partitioning protein [Bdellovibrionales bacterium]
KNKLINKIKKGFSEKVDAEESLKNELVQGVAEELKKLLGTKVTIDYNSKSKGKIAIHFYSDLEFNSIIDGIRKSWQK